MGRILLLRSWHGLIVIMGVTIVVFVVTRMIGDPVDIMLPLEATAEQRAAFEHQLGLDRPILVQFFDYVWSLAQFDLGDSLWQNRPALEIILERLPLTLYLCFSAIAVAVLVAVPMGVIAALKPGGIIDKITVLLSLGALSVPQFWLGLLFIMVFAVQLGWLPAGGAASFKHLILPALTLAIPTMTRLVMVVRSQMMDELNAQYVKTAEAKGMPLFRIVGLHAMRNCAVPVMTLTAWEFIRILSGYTVVVETVFAWPGLGLIALQAIERQDLVLLQAIVFVIAVIVVVFNLAVDIIYKVIDPRIKLD
ncbi:ABC transporter permease [Oceanibium sediminis]|uniref:ABC transporter permease n=1 Tax=Oceanibium sediminis TaxID=2026339 RepID=UPI000DD3BC12|nr:ABC transporter permease [Oceanibium sediminis]